MSPDKNGLLLNTILIMLDSEQTDLMHKISSLIRIFAEHTLSCSKVHFLTFLLV